jgi:hypothetical protein
MTNDALKRKVLGNNGRTKAKRSRRLIVFQLLTCTAASAPSAFPGGTVSSIWIPLLASCTRRPARLALRKQTTPLSQTNPIRLRTARHPSSQSAEPVLQSAWDHLLGLCYSIVGCGCIRDNETGYYWRHLLRSSMKMPCQEDWPRRRLSRVRR